MRKWAIGCGSLFIAAVFATMAYRAARDRSDAIRERTDLASQLRLARADGLPTSIDELTPSLPSPRDDENAALIYRQIQSSSGTSAKVAEAERELLFQPSATHTRQADELLMKNRDTLNLVDRASALPRCAIDNKLGLGVMPAQEYSAMETTARLLALRGSLAAAEGRSSDALHDSREIFAVSRQARGEGFWFPIITSDFVYSFGLYQLALWSYLYPETTGYRRALEMAANDWPKARIKAINRDQCADLLYAIDHAGLKDAEEAKLRSPSWASIFGTKLPNPVRAKGEVIAAERMIWACLNGRWEERLLKVGEAKDAIKLALAAFPKTSEIAEIFVRNKDRFLYDYFSDVQRIQFIALARALKKRPFPKNFTFEDLKSPFDGKPVTCRFDGKRLMIAVSCPIAVARLDPLKVPPDDGR